MGMAKRAWQEAERIGLGGIDGALCSRHVRDSYLVSVLDRVGGVCHVCTAAGEDLLSAEELLRAMLELLSEDYGDVSSPYAHSRDVYELFYDYFGDLFDRDDPIDIFEWLVTGVSRDEWGIADEIPWEDEDELSVFDSTSSKWQQFAELVQTESRFIFLAAGSTRVPAGGVTAAEFVADFSRILIEHEGSLVRTLDTGTSFYRGRMATGIADVERISYARELGPAPGNLAAASRMSPAGISMFYASEYRDTAVAEIGAHDEAQRDFAVVGAFKSLRELRILDLFDVEAPSIFDRQRRSERSDMMFLREFAADITRPIRLDGRQHREYSPTQVLTELIRWSEAPLVDGIRLKSAQDSRPTYVLFFGPDSVTDDVAERPTAMFTLGSGDIEVVQLRRVIEVDSVPRWRLASQWVSPSADAPISED